jgi:hypothetical protein
MTSLLDIGDLTEEVEVRGHKLRVRGISAEGFVILLQRFPELRRVMTGGADAEVIQSLVAKLPDAVACIVACGTGTPGNTDAEKQASLLAAGEQVELLSRIWHLTFPRGVKDFLDALASLAEQLAGELGRDQDTRSPGPSSGASETATPSSAPGDTPRGS